MKKIIVFLILLMIPLTIKAEDYYLEFKSDKIYSDRQINLFYKDGFIFIDGNEIFRDSAAEGLLSYYDKKGDCIKTKYLEGQTPYAAVTDNEYIYVIVISMEGDRTIHGILKFDENLDIVATFKENQLDLYRIGQGTNMDVNRIVVKDNKVLFHFWDSLYNKDYIIALNQNLTNPTVTLTSESEYANEFVVPPSNYVFVKYNNYYYNAGYSNNCGEGNTNNPSCGIISKGNPDFSIAWKNQYYDYTIIPEIDINSRNIYAVGVKADKTKEILKLDLDGNLLSKYNIDNVIGNIKANDDYLIVNTGTAAECMLSFDNESGGKCKSMLYHSVYRLLYDIEHKVNGGKGKVEVPLNSVKGEKVTIKITPEEGYVLKALKVFDMEGNEIKVTNNTFIMPESDVRIEAVFVLGTEYSEQPNPETRDKLVIFAAIIFILSGVYTISVSRRLKRG